MLHSFFATIASMTAEAESLIAERAARIELLQGLVEQGINASDVIGYHATSVEAIEYFIQHGRMAGWTGENYKDPSLPQNGDLYFVPLQGAIPKFPGDEQFKSPSFVLDEMERMAEARGRKHRFLNVLGLPYTSEEPSVSVPEFLFSDGLPSESLPITIHTDEDYVRLLKLRQRSQIEHAIDSAKERKGVIAAVSSKVLKYGMPELAEGDLRVSMHRVPFEDLFSGIKPMGNADRQFFRTLRV
jgi:hypothetical protein